MIATYEKTIYKDESCGFCICAYRTREESVPAAARKAGSRDGLIHFTATGYLLPETSAVQVDLSGHWEKSRYGPQLAVNNYREILPSTEVGILGYWPLRPKGQWVDRMRNSAMCRVSSLNRSTASRSWPSSGRCRGFMPCAPFREYPGPHSHTGR